MSRPLDVRTSAIAPLYPKFWALFNATAASTSAPYRAPSGLDDNWYGWGIGGKGATLCARASLSRNDAMVLISILSKVHRDACFGLLKRDQAAIEREIGVALTWNDTKKEPRIGFSWSVPLNDPADWPGSAAQIIARLQAFDAAFRPRVENMDVGAWTRILPVSGGATA